MKKITLVLMCCTICSLISDAQVSTGNCEEAKKFYESFKGDCMSKITAHNCVRLDVTDSYDFQGKEFIFQWEMGDGTYLEGMEVSHCYESPGAYSAILSLKDPLTKVTISEEAKVDVMIKGAFSLKMDVSDKNEVDLPVNFGHELIFPESTYRLDKVYWHFGDGLFSCENKPEHTYSTPGSFKASVIVSLSSGNNREILCTSDTIQVSMGDPSEGLLMEVFDNMQVESRFLADDIHYKILAINQGAFEEVLNHDSLSGGTIYKLLAFRGDLVFDSQEIVTDVTASDDIVRYTINNQAKSLAKTEPLKFNSLFFELDQDELSRKNKKIIKRNIELLQKFPMLKLGIGVYTNAKGSLQKGIKLSIRRGQLIKEYMIENGIADARIVVMNPESARSLINSCVTGMNCDYADPALNRRADFKILKELVN